MKAPLAANTSFVVEAYETEVTQTVGSITVGEDEVGIWPAANIPINLRHSVVTTVDVLYRYALSNIDNIAISGDNVLFYAELGSTKVTVDGTPDASDIRLYVGNGKARDHIALTNAVFRLRDAFLEATTGN
jgi:hypothetical protein